MHMNWSGDYVNRAEAPGDPLLNSIQGRASVFTPWDVGASAASFDPVSTRPPDYHATADTTSTFAAQVSQGAADAVSGPIDVVKEYVLGGLGKLGAVAIGIIAVGLGLYVLTTSGD
jgi:hypothetical protein